MIKVQSVKVKKEDVNNKSMHLLLLADALKVKKDDILDYRILRRSLDARRKNDIHYVFSFLCSLKEGVSYKRSASVSQYLEPKKQQLKITKPLHVCVVGSGPAGLFSALTLLKAGAKVTLLERGKKIEERQKDVEKLLTEGIFNEKSNIQFGEGGAGTFSDGKLNTGIGSPLVGEVLETFYENGAPEEILYDAKPHIGTDVLSKVIVNMRRKLIALGAELHFDSEFKDFERLGNKLKIVYESEGGRANFLCDELLLCLGYSARDSFLILYDKGLSFAQKPFSVGYRIEHLQKDINRAQYGIERDEFLPPADYKLFHHLENGRTVYTFCMCPGGTVVPAASEKNGLCTNGMSYHSRGGENANSAILVSVDARDYNSSHPLAGMFYQQRLEQNAYRAGGGKYIVSRLEDFISERESLRVGKVKPTIGINGKLGNCFNLLDRELACSVKSGISEFAKKLKGFDDPDAILTGIETRSSAPFSIVRFEKNSTSLENVYAAGEGSGHAGGIVSSAVDGIKVAKSILEKYL